MTIIRVGLDTLRRVFQVHRVDEAEQPAIRRMLRRCEVAKHLAELPPTRVGLLATDLSAETGVPPLTNDIEGRRKPAFPDEIAPRPEDCAGMWPITKARSAS